MTLNKTGFRREQFVLEQTVLERGFYKTDFVEMWNIRSGTGCFVLFCIILHFGFNFFVVVAVKRFSFSFIIIFFIV